MDITLSQNLINSQSQSLFSHIILKLGFYA